ncbi:dipeptidase [Clostridium sp. Mt-5]|uniref:Dipeptidase n=1 Tax=Clostridium moutaii TaxID=3240932 RepID=A0ABV4BRR8_9CLOT
MGWGILSPFPLNILMKIFDGHSDILTDVTIKRMEGKKNILKNYHIDRLKKGGVGASILVNWVDPPFDKNPMNRMIQVLGSTFEEIQDMADCAAIAYNAEDIEKIKENGKFAIILGFEGLSGLGKNVSFLNALYFLGIRHSMLTWNEENEFATGVLSPHEDRGVTKLGVQALKKMEQLKMIVDVSHANEKTFWDIYENTTRPFIASHSNCYAICPSNRNLKDDQIKAVAERGCVIGMNAWPDFISNDGNPTLEKFAYHVDHIADLVGIDHISLGFDFCDFLGTDSTESFQQGSLNATPGIEDASKISNFLKILKKRGYTKEQIEKISYRNIMRVIREILG